MCMSTWCWNRVCTFSASNHRRYVRKVEQKWFANICWLVYNDGKVLMTSMTLDMHQFSFFFFSIFYFHKLMHYGKHIHTCSQFLLYIFSLFLFRLSSRRYSAQRTAHSYLILKNFHKQDYFVVQRSADARYNLYCDLAIRYSSSSLWFLWSDKVLICCSYLFSFFMWKGSESSLFIFLWTFANIAFTFGLRFVASFLK